MKKGAFSILCLALATTAVTACSSTSTTQEQTSALESGANQPATATVPHAFGGTGGVYGFQRIGSNWHYGASRSANVQNACIVLPEFGHMKLFMKNYASAAVSVSLTHVASSKVYFHESIDAGGTLDWRSYDHGITQGVRAGIYILQWSGGGTNVDSEVWGYAASSPGY